MIRVARVAITDSKIDGVDVRDDNRSDLEEPCRNPRPWQCSICTHENDTSYLSCELCGVLRDLSLYSNNASEVEDGAKHTNKHSGASVLAISLFTPSSAKSKVVVFSDGFQANKNATGNIQTTLDALHKTYVTHKQRRVIGNPGQRSSCGGIRNSEGPWSSIPTIVGKHHCSGHCGSSAREDLICRLRLEKISRLKVSYYSKYQKPSASEEKNRS